MASFKDAPKSRFSKIAGVDGMIYDSASGRLILTGETAAQPSNWLAGQDDKSKNLKIKEDYKNRKTMSESDWMMLASVVPDIASIADVEPATAAALAATGSGMRNVARALEPGNMTAADYGW